MRTVFSSHSELAHVYAQQCQPSGRANNMFFEGATLYSYGYHFPLAYFVNGDTVILNTDSYSVSTCKHQSHTRRALSHKNTIDCSDDAILKELISYHSHDAKKIKAPYVVEAIEKHLQRTFIYAAKSASKRRKQSLRDNDITSALSDYDSIVKCCEAVGLKLPKRIDNMAIAFRDDFTLTLARAEQAEKRKKAKAEKERKALEKQITLECKEAIDAIKSGNIPDARMAQRLHHVRKVYMWLDDDVIKTSHGAAFPLDDAKRAFKFIKHAVARKQGFTPNSALPAPKLGYYSIDEIKPNGDVKAGCHYVQYDQIERIAKQLSLI